MPLKAIVSDINQIDEAHRPLYVAKDGKFILDVAPTDGYELDNITGLKSALGAERQAKSDLEARIKAFEGLDPTAVRKTLTDFENLSKIDPEKEADRLAAEKIKTREALLTAEFEKKLNPLQDTVQRRESQIKKLLVDNAISISLGALNPLDDARDAIALLAAQSMRVKEINGEFAVQVVDEAGNPRIKDVHGSPMGVADYLTELREKRPSLFKADSKSGAGMSPGGGAGHQSSSANPWKKDSFNLTEQMTLLNTNPTLAARLKQEAGVK